MQERINRETNSDILERLSGGQEIEEQTRRMLGSLGYVDALEHVEPDMIEPAPATSRWLHAPEKTE